MSLTDDWRAGKLNEKSIWWADLGNEKIEPARVDEYGYLFGLDGCFYSPERCEYVKILATCDYANFVELNKMVKALEKDVENLTNNYKLLESVQAVEIAHGQALVDEFGDCEAVYQEITRLRNENRQLRQILKESYSILEKDFQKETMAENFARNRWQKSLKILDKIDEVLK